MKTARFALILALLSITLIGFSQDFRSERKGARFYLSVDQAVTDRGLMYAMYRLIDKSFLDVEQPGLYVVKVNYNRATYVISGTRERWISFFTNDRRRTERRPDNEN